MRDHPLFLGDDSWHLDLSDNIIADIENSLEHPDRFPYFQLTPIRKKTLDRKFEQLQEAGVVLMIGTDSGVPMLFHSQSTWTELDAWVNELGVDPMTAIRGATYWPALFMNVEKDYGTVSEGKYADIIAVEGDVMRYINLLSDVDMVFKHGKQYK
jgi:imidazolonepropionase-like amidohydrolase